MKKKQLRKQMIASLLEISPSEKKGIEKQLAEALLHTEQWMQAKTIGITISSGFEWDTKSIIQTAWETGRNVCVPKCQPDEKKLTFHQLNSFAELEKSYFNLMEPIPDLTAIVQKEAIDLLLVPGIVFDANGYRIGFGGGYYDRFLTDYPNETLSLVCSQQLVASIPAAPYDIPVKHILTENQLIHTMEGAS